MGKRINIMIKCEPRLSVNENSLYNYIINKDSNTS
jgi:hypothetical protein